MLRRPSLRHEFLLDPAIVHLNHGGFGAVPRPVFDEYRGWQEQLERHPSAILSHGFDQAMDRARESLASFVGCSPTDLALVPNTTSGLNAVARSLPFRAGDEILATNHEYAAMDILWEQVCRMAGARYRRHFLPVPVDDEDALVESLFTAVTPSTRAIFVSHISSITAIRLPVEKICRRARAMGLMTIIDGAHAVGQIEVNLDDLGADIYAASCHKWMCAPRGTGFLYVRAEHQDLIHPALTSHGCRPGSDFLERFRWQGTTDPCALLSLPTAIAFIQDPRWRAGQRRSRELAEHTRQAGCALFGLRPLTPSGSNWYAQMVAVPVPFCDAIRARQALLRDHGVDVPVRIWEGIAVARVSLQAYNNTDDVRRLITALAAVLPAA